MQASAYLAAVEEVFDQPISLERLRDSAERDPDLDEMDRTQVLSRADRYRADEHRRHADEEGEVEVGDELEGAA